MKVTVDLPSIRTAMDNVNKFVRETHFNIEDGCLVLREISACASAFYEAKISDIVVEGEGTFDAFINAEHINKMLKHMGKTGEVVLEYANSQLTLASVNGKKRFTLPIYTDDYEGRKTPEIPFKIAGKMPSARLASIVSAAEAGSKDATSIKFIVNRGKLLVKSASDLYKYEEVVEEFESNEDNATALYKISWLNSITDCLVSDVVEFNFDTDMPLTVVDKGADKLKQRFVLAQMIEHD